ncbi:hypothetical protein JOQ06_013183, partial [Pogonophryne albipinna]
RSDCWVGSIRMPQPAGRAGLQRPMGGMKGESGGGCPVGRLHCGACCCYACPPTGESMGREEEWRGADRAEGVYYTCTQSPPVIAVDSTH